MEDLRALNPELRSRHADPARGLRAEGAGGTRDRAGAYADAADAKPPTFHTYVAKKGDTLPRIAKKHGVSVASLASANSLLPERRSPAARRS